MKRKHQIILILSLLGLTWLGMMIVHEVGHVIGAWTSGGIVSSVNLPLFGFSWTEYAHNPNPLWVVWAGPLFGVLLPVIAWLLAAFFKAGFAYLLRFFAGFCLLANGAYLGIGVFEQIADAGDLVGLGASRWQLWLFGGICVPAGFALWHTLGPRFGLGEAKGQVNHRHAVVLFCLLIAVIMFETLLQLV